MEATFFVDGYYGYNFNELDTKFRNFDNEHNTLSINFVEVAFEQKVSRESRVGFRADLGFGPVADTVASLEPNGGSEIFKYLQQGYASFLPASRLQLDLGKFVTPHGAEVIEAKDNWNYSRSLLFALAIPYYHVGLRATSTVNDKLSVVGYFVNGWNNSTENNSGKTFGLGATFKPISRLTWVANAMAGPEQETGGNDRLLVDTTITFAATDKLSFMANYDYGRDRFERDRVSWSGIALYAKLQATPWLAVAPRFEWLDDGDAFMTGTSQTLKEVTLTGEFKLAGGLLTRLEYRKDFSDEPIFPTSSGDTRKSQTTLTVGVLYAFGGKI